MLAQFFQLDFCMEWFYAYEHVCSWIVVFLTVLELGWMLEDGQL
jgi:hypothetical protein